MITKATQQAISAYDPNAPLSEAGTIPSAWYTDSDLYRLERQAVFGASWQLVARLDQLEKPGDYVTANIAGEPIVVVRGKDEILRGFYNVCRHHAAEIATEPCGHAGILRCPYHGWSYTLDGQLKGTPEFDGVRNFNPAENGLIPVRVDAWEQFVFVCLEEGEPGLLEFLGGFVRRTAPHGLSNLKFVRRCEYELACNWKVFVDNYLDGGYHVPYIHKALRSVIDYAEYKIEAVERFCVQSTPLGSAGGDETTRSVRKGDRAYYYWVYPNLMLNYYEGYLDTNLALPLGVDRTRVIFDFYFLPGADGKSETDTSIDVAEVVQQEDIDICESVQRGLQSRAYDVGRLSVRREAGEHQFHRLLHAALSRNGTA